jgi:hypothetical protein
MDSFPVRIELVDGELAVRVYVHEVMSKAGPVPCWTYVSEGMLKHWQKEMIFTLARDPQIDPRAFPEDPMRLMSSAYSMAAEGRTVREGGHSQLIDPVFLGHRSIVYVRPTELPGVRIPAPSIAVVLLKDEEFEVAGKFGVNRVMVNLGRAYRHYPWPPWSDPSRSVLPVASDLNSSFLMGLPLAPAPGVSVLQEGGQVVLQSVRKAAEYLREGMKDLDPGMPRVLLTDLDPTADSCLVWQPGQEGPEAIAKQDSEGDRLAGCFIAFVPGQTADGGRICEDGYAMMLTDESWSAIRRCIETEKPLSIPGKGGELGFRWNWIPNEYHNPVDGNVYYNDDGWHTFHPLKPQLESAPGAADLQAVIMLNQAWELGTRVGVEELSEYMKALSHESSEYFQDFPEVSQQDLLLQVTVGLGSLAETRLATRPGIGSEAARGLRGRLARVPTPVVEGSAISFQLRIAVRGGTGIPWTWGDEPAEEAAGDQGGASASVQTPRWVVDG